MCNWELFSTTDRDSPGAFECNISHHRYAPNQVVFAEGDTADSVYNIASGDVRLYKLLSDGRRQITGFLQTGDYIGLMSRDVYAYGAEAINDVELCCIRSVDLASLLQERPAAGLKLFELCTDELAAAQDQMLILGRKSARERVLSFLLRRAERSAGGLVAGVEIRLPMSRGDIADYLGLCHETVSRTFSNLKQDGLVAVLPSHRVRLLDLAAVRSGAGIG